MDRSTVTRLKSHLIAGVGVVSVLLLTSGATAAPQLVLVNAKVFTADPALPYAQAVAIEDGRILAVGRNEQVRALAGPNSRIIDAGGRLVTPGLTEAHVHLGDALRRRRWPCQLRHFLVLGRRRRKSWLLWNRPQRRARTGSALISVH